VLATILRAQPSDSHCRGTLLLTGCSCTVQVRTVYLIEDVFMNTAASVIPKIFQARCEYDETLRMECMEPVGSQRTRVFADENQPGRCQETHARVNSQYLSRKRFLSHHRQIIALMTRKDATQEERMRPGADTFGRPYSGSSRSIEDVCQLQFPVPCKGHVMN
jgi:hypothetical protein